MYKHKPVYNIYRYQNHLSVQTQTCLQYLPIPKPPQCTNTNLFTISTDTKTISVYKHKPVYNIYRYQNHLSVQTQTCLQYLPIPKPSQCTNTNLFTISTDTKTTSVYKHKPAYNIYRYQNHPSVQTQTCLQYLPIPKPPQCTNTNLFTITTDTKTISVYKHKPVYNIYRYQNHLSVQTQTCLQYLPIPKPPQCRNTNLFTISTDTKTISVYKHKPAYNIYRYQNHLSVQTQTCLQYLPIPKPPQCTNTNLFTISTDTKITSVYKHKPAYFSKTQNKVDNRHLLVVCLSYYGRCGGNGCFQHPDKNYRLPTEAI